jgi:putative ATP-binding cassette transporter
LDWNQELVNSLVWLAQAFLITAAGVSVLAFLLSRFTLWGRQFRRLAGPYFSPRRSWKPLLTVLLVLLLALFSVRMNVLLSYWSKEFYNAIQELNQPVFWWALGLFGVLATVHVVRAMITFYVQQSFEIHWRIWLNDNVVDDWMAGAAYYRGQFLKEPIDNPDQRVQMDVANFVTFSIKLAVGAVQALVSLLEFTLILWSLSGALTLMGVEIPRAMVMLVYVYVLVASLLAFKIGRPLIGLNFLSERLAANYRYALMRFREYAESIAFFRGEPVERSVFATRFSSLIANAWAIVFRTMKFTGFNLSVSQLAVVFPYIIQAPRFFAGQIKLGDVTQTARAFGEVEEALSFFRSSYDDFAQYRAILNRLTGFLDANQEARELPVVTTTGVEKGLALREVVVRRPDAQVMVYRLQLQLEAGQSLLIQGPSGSGKTTLLRSLASLWPYADGEVRRPLGQQALFLSQKPYLPLGSLRTALNYPAVKTTDALLIDALRKVQLGHLQDRLDVEDDWSRILSLGEQQRLAFARVLVNQPRLAFLDEATSATDEGLEHALYALLRKELPQCVLVSVGHRSTLTQFHSHVLHLRGEAHQGQWTFDANPHT